MWLPWLEMGGTIGESFFLSLSGCTRGSFVVDGFCMVVWIPGSGVWSGVCVIREGLKGQKCRWVRVLSACGWN